MSRGAAARLEALECPAFVHRREHVPPIVLATGLGSNVYDVDGNRYVDLVAGFGALPLGHSATAVVRSLEAQADRMMQGLGDVYSADAKVALLERLASLAGDALSGPKPRVLLGLTGSDAVTAAIKTATLATGRPGLVAFEGAYHGLGYAPLAVCGLRESYRAPFAAQLNPRAAFAPYPRTESDLARSLDALDALLRRGDVAAVLVEPILGRGGCVVPPLGFLPGVCEAAHRHGALVVADEIWTGLGRAGALLYAKEVETRVDIVCIGKGLGGGLPISACIAPDAIMQAWAREPEVVHTATHSGMPLACATAVATLDTLRFRQLVLRTKEVGARMQAFLSGELSTSGGVVAVRGAGLMIGIELESAELARRATRRLLEAGFISLTGGVHGEVITWTPALTIDEALLRDAGTALRDAIASG